MCPRIVVHRITVLLAAYALAMATVIMPLSVWATHAVDVACLAGGVFLAPMPDNAPDKDHVTCGLCVAGCPVAPLPGGAQQAQPGQISAPSPQHNLEQAPQSRAHAGPGLARPPPQSA